MKIINKLKTVVGLLSACLVLYGCSDNLEEHTAVNDSRLEKSLTERISEEPELSEFYALLEDTGFDEILEGSKSYTVWAPTNEALADVPSDILNDSERLRQFISNHVSLSSFTTDMFVTEDTLDVQMLTSKYASFLPGPSIRGVNISRADQYAANGVYHILNGDLAPQYSVWEYISVNPDNYNQNQFIASLNYFDLFMVEDRLDMIEDVEDIEDVEELMEIYRDTIANEVLRTFDLRDEQKDFTYFVMSNDGFRQEKEKLIPFSKRGSQDSTLMLAQYHVVKDLVFEGIYTPENLPDTLTSIDGVKVPVGEVSFIEDPRHLSNGIVYFVERLDVEMENKLRPVRIEGEDAWGFSHNRDEDLYYRERLDPSGVPFADLVVRDQGVDNFSVHYEAPHLYSTTYEVYFRAVNDFDSEFMQRLRIGGRYLLQEDEDLELVDVIKETEPVAISPDVYDEIYAGEFTLEQAGDIDMISLRAQGDDPLSLDYMRLVPVIE